MPAAAAILEGLQRGTAAAAAARSRRRTDQVEAVRCELADEPLSRDIAARDVRLAVLRTRYSVRAIAIASGLSHETVRLAPARVARRSAA